MIKIDFLVVGAQKCGTTTLHDFLSKIEGVSLPSNKESHFFSHDEKYGKGVDWYTSLFSENADVAGEVDPEYLYVEKSLGRIKEHVGNTKLIFMFRDPCRRAISHFKMSRRRGMENLSFYDALMVEADRRATEDPLLFDNHHSYVSRSLYAKQLERYLDVFPESEKFYIKFEDFYRDDDLARDSQMRLLKFIGISSPQDISIGGSKSNEAAAPKWEIINTVLWDKNFLLPIRKLFRKIVTKENRRILLNKVYNWNVKRSGKPENYVGDYVFPDEILANMRKDAEKLEELTGLNLSDWEIFSTSLARES